MRIKITADSTCDLPRELVEQYGIGIVPLSIVKDSVPYKDGLEITPQDIFDYVESGAGMTQTTAISPGEYEDAFRGFLADCDAVIHLNIGSGFSACHQNARLAAAELENVYPVDSENLSIGTGCLAIDAAKWAGEGLNPAEIVERLEARRGKLEVSFVIDTLKYLRKGGRCSALQAMGANLLNLKPCIQVVDGKMGVGKKYRGQFENVLPEYIKDKLADRDDIDTERLHVTCTAGVSDEFAAEMRAIAEGYVPFGEVHPSIAGCAVSVHCGPKTLGVIYYRK